MSFSLGNKVQIEVSGASHSEKIVVKLSGIDQGHRIDMNNVLTLLDRRSGGKAIYTTKRREADRPLIICGLDEGITTGDTIIAEFLNSNVRRADYGQQKNGFIPRPSHADYAAYTKYNGEIDLSGGGFFSGRMTLPMCFAGAIVRQILEEEGILIGAHISSVGDIEDVGMNPLEEDIELAETVLMDEAGENVIAALPVIDPEAAGRMNDLMTEIAQEGDSIGGTIECKITGLPVGLGDPIYDSVESALSYGMFGIPAVKGIEFGAGFDITKMKGSSANDGFFISDGAVRCVTNNSGGIQGGLTNGMPIIFKVAIKPTPSIYKEQKSVDLVSMEEKILKIEGRHDACIVPRAVPCVEAMAALVIYDLLLQNRS